MNQGGVQIIFILSIITHQCLKKWVLVLECNLCTSFALFTSLNINVLHLIIVIYLCFTFVGALILLISDKIELQDDV